MGVYFLEDMNQCYGCGACQNRCSVDAIEMVSNNEGFWEPKINHKKCINCGKCEKVCPVLVNEDALNVNDPDVYAFRARESKILEQSSAGGAFTLLAELIIEWGGYVAGAAYDDDFSVHHVVVSTTEELEKLRYSKYVQSRPEYCYKETKLLLEGGANVLYTGVPCQIAGLKTYLERDYDNLFTIDLLCHGVPSPGIYKDYIEERFGLENITNILMRGRKEWRGRFDVTLKDGKEIKYQNRKNAYLTGFLNDCFLRPTCYGCKYARIPRQGDITLGDFWPVKKWKIDEMYEKRSNIVLVNSLKGKMLWKKLIDSSETDVYMQKLSYDKRKLNRNIYEPLIVKPKNKEEFFCYREAGFDVESAVHKTLHKYDVGLVLYMSDNYGSTATNFALYRAVENLGHTPIILDNLAGAEGVSARFVQRHLNIASRFLEKGDYYAVNKMCDSFVVGSDQSWRWDFRITKKYMEYLLMAFVADNKRKISYGASFGPEKYDLDTDIRALYSSLLSRFNAISVREDYAVDMCKRNFGVNAVQVVDPVFLIDKQDYLDIAKNSELKFDGEYLFAYIRFPSPEKRRLIRDMATYLNMKAIVACDANGYDKLKEQFDMEEVIDKPEFIDWLAYYVNASCIITDSFHGTCFSMIFEKKFISIKAGTRERFDSLEALFADKDEKWFYESTEELIDRTDIIKELDYERVSATLREKRNECLTWLTEALMTDYKNVDTTQMLVDYTRLMCKDLDRKTKLAKYAHEESLRSIRDEYIKAKNCNYLEGQKFASGVEITETSLAFDKEGSVAEYFKRLMASDKYTLLISCKDDCSKNWDDFIKNSNLPLKKKPGFHNSYIAIIERSNTIYEDFSSEPLIKNHVFLPYRNIISASENEKDNDTLYLKLNPVNIRILSKKYDSKLKDQTSRIFVNNVDYSINRRGLNFVVIDGEVGEIVDCFAIDLYNDAKLKIIRK